MSDTTSGPMSGMLDPSTLMLLGASQGFGQAAMPSRMPVPFGAALGMAAGGVAQGARDAQAMQLQQQQIQAARLNNQRTQAMMNYFSGGSAPGGGGFGSIAPGGAAVGGVPGRQGGAPTTTDANGRYLMSPQQTLSLANMMAFGGQDRAAAQLYGNLGTQAGGPGYAMGPNGQAFAVPGGGKDPGTIYTNSNAAALGKVGPAAAIATNAANIGLQEKYATPGTQPGGVYGTPGQTLGAVPQIGADGKIAPTGSAAPTADPFPGYAAQINGAENTTGNPAAKNPGSSATGNGQFLDGTWPSVIRSVRPDLTAGKTDAQIMALRNDPGLAQSATEAYARQNGAALAQAGVPVTPGNIYMSHFLGPNGAIAMSRAAPNTPVSLLVPQSVIAVNPPLQGAGKTVGDVQAWAAQKMASGSPSTTGSQPSGPAYVAPGVTRTQLPNGSFQTTDMKPQMDQQYQADMKAADGATDDIAHAQGQQVRLMAQRDALQNLPTGALGNDRLAIANYVKTYMPAVADSWLAKAAQIPDASLGQEFSKLALTSAGEQERGVLGGRGGFRAIELYKSANPNMELQPDANRQILNMQLVAQQADIDYARGLQQTVNQNGQTYTSGKGDYVPSSHFDQQWTAQRNPQVYSAAIAAMNGKPFDAWSRGLNQQEGLRALQIIGRIDPNATVLDDNNKPRRITSFLPQQASN